MNILDCFRRKVEPGDWLLTIRHEPSYPMRTRMVLVAIMKTEWWSHTGQWEITGKYMDGQLVYFDGEDGEPCPDFAISSYNPARDI